MGCVSAARKSPKLKAAIHVDTGMNRLGLTVPQGLTLKDSSELKDFETALLMSHFVSAEESDNPLNVQQIEAFQAVRASLPGIPASLANSSGIFLKDKPHFDLARPGYALYGGNPTPDRGQSHARRSSGSKAASCSCAGSRRITRSAITAAGLPSTQRRIATLSVGYADGYPRSSSARGKSGDELLAGMALVGGQPCPFAGNVSMDLITVDVTDVPEAQVKRGDTVTLIGGDLTIDEVGRRAGTIGYEILTNLGCALRPRLSRGRRLMAKRVTPPSSARNAARSITAGKASARPAAAGTPSSRKPAPQARWRARSPRARPAPRAGSSRSKACPARPRKRRARPPASPSSTASPAAASCTARSSCSAAIRASASRRSSCRPPPPWPSAASASPTSRAKRRWRRCACAPSVSASARRPSNSPPRPMSRTSSRP